VALTEAGGDVAGEVAQTDTLSAPYRTDKVAFLRAPYGNWRQKRAPDSDEDRDTSIVAALLNGSGRFGHYVGPINWDISAQNYDFWKRGASAQECAEAYLVKIERLDHGIVLMHDSSEDPGVAARNRSLETTRRLVPALKECGYRFVGLDTVSQVRRAAPGVFSRIGSTMTSGMTVSSG
jgi:hypothetical protein